MFDIRYLWLISLGGQFFFTYIYFFFGGVGVGWGRCVCGGWAGGGGAFSNCTKKKELAFTFPENMIIFF